MKPYFLSLLKKKKERTKKKTKKYIARAYFVSPYTWPPIESLRLKVQIDFNSRITLQNHLLQATISIIKYLFSPPPCVPPAACVSSQRGNPIRQVQEWWKGHSSANSNRDCVSTITVGDILTFVLNSGDPVIPLSLDCRLSFIADHNIGGVGAQAIVFVFSKEV